jgi:hypothetical protein
MASKVFTERMTVNLMPEQKRAQHPRIKRFLSQIL